MISWAFGRSGQALRRVSLAAIMAMAVVAVTPLAVHAEADEPGASQQQKPKKKSFFSAFGSSAPATSNANTPAHSAGSGLKATTATGVLNDDSVAPFITADSPAAMEAMAEKYARIAADGGWPRLPKGNLKKGSDGKNTGLLNRRLHIEGYLRVEGTQGQFADVFTSATEEALKQFQRNNGLAVTGSVDGPTLLALNVPAERRLATIRANIPRLAEYSKGLGSRYIVVNIPAQQIETVNDGKVYSLHNAIVGRAMRPTPVVMTPLTIVRFNPYWNAPSSIVEKDILPRMLSRGPSKIMREMNMKVFDGVGGPEIDPDDVNWRRVRVDDYHFRQEPGGANAMATAKIEFNSPFGIYLHDTPEPHLFKTANRFYSSGCVRVEQVAIMIDWILRGQDGLTAARIAELANSKERLDTTIINPPQLRVAYLTAWPAKGGVAAFRPDVYELDGTGFVVGQPLPVGEKLDGQRYVLKPIPRLQEDIDTDDGFGFASLFRGNSSRDDVMMPGQNSKSGDSLISLNNTKAKKDAERQRAEKARLAKQKADEKARLAKKKADEKAKLAKQKADEKAKLAKQKADEKAKLAKQKADEKAKLAKAAAKDKKVVKKDATRKAGTKTVAAAPGKDVKVKAKTATAKKPAACKPGTDGKTPAGCTAAAAPKAPAAKPASGKTAAAN
jgi:peptidoglycan hydrolase-like protein with peptidoglycan-binding domain